MFWRGAQAITSNQCQPITGSFRPISPYRRSSGAAARVHYSRPHKAGPHLRSQMSSRRIAAALPISFRNSDMEEIRAQEEEEQAKLRSFFQDIYDEVDLNPPWWTSAGLDMSDCPFNQSFTWRARGLLPKVGEQPALKKMGWIFALVECLECMYAFENAEFIHLSKQQLLDNCASGDATNKCDGYAAFQWVISNGITTYDDYPWVEVKQTPLLKKPKFILENCERIDGCEEDVIERRLYKHPLFATIRVTPKQIYKKLEVRHSIRSAIKPAGEEVREHNVLLTGWGELDGVRVWEAMDCFGPNFGHGGFLYFTRNSSTKSFEFNQLAYVIDPQGFSKVPS